MPRAAQERRSLREIGWLFLRLGTISFGGPAVHIAMMEDEVVRRRKWLRPEEFLDLLGATNLIPGPNSTELAIHVGYKRGGWPGLVVAGVSFVVPAVAMVWALAFAYGRYGRVPEVMAALYGIKPVVVVLVLQALWGLGRSAVRTAALAVAACAAVAMLVARIDELVVLWTMGVSMLLVRRLARGSHGWQAVAPGLAPVSVAAAVAVAAPFQLSTLFLTFLKIGSVLFGSGYVLLAFLRSEFVVKLGWLTEGQLFDAIAVGQLTPGPLFTTATFVGFLVGGHAGAAVATAGIFLPAFVFVALSGPLVPALRRSEAASAFLDGINVASLALMLVVSVQFWKDALRDPATTTIALVAALLVWRYRVNSGWLVLGGAIAGVWLGR